MSNYNETCYQSQLLSTNPHDFFEIVGILFLFPQLTTSSPQVINSQILKWLIYALIIPCLHVDNYPVRINYR